MPWDSIRSIPSLPSPGWNIRGVFSLCILPPFLAYWAYPAYLPSIAQSAAEGPAYSPAPAVSGVEKTTAHVSSLDSGGETNAPALLSLPLAHSFFHAEGPDWLGR